MKHNKRCRLTTTLKFHLKYDVNIVNDILDAEDSDHMHCILSHILCRVILVILQISGKITTNAHRYYESQRNIWGTTKQK